MSHLSKREYYALPQVAARYHDFSFGGPSGAWVEQREADLLLAMVGGATPVLDLACGDGRLAHRLAARAHVVGCDTSLPMLKAAQREAPAPLAAGDAFRLPFAARSFECVVCSRLLFHYPDSEPIFREVHRVTTPAGWMVFDTFRWSPRARLPILRTSFDGPIFTTSVREVTRRLRAANWTVLDRKGCFLFSPLAHRFLPLRLVRLLAAVERACPDRLLVKDYWKAGKRPTA